MILLDRMIGSSTRTVAGDPVTYMVIVQEQKARPVQSTVSEPRYPVVGRLAITNPEIPSISTGASSFEESPAIDRNEVVARAAQEYVKQHPELLTPSRSEKAPLLFKNNDHAPGNVRQSGGKIVQWLNSTCYLTIRDGELDTGPPYNGARIQKTCILSKPDGEKLDHLKPEYLKKPVEDICPKDMAGCDHKK